MELFNHQKEGIRLLKEKNRAILADSMGLGKSRQAIVAAKESNASGILIVCPASLKINWEREIKIVYPDAKVDTILEDINEAVDQGEKVIVFSQYTKTIDEIVKGMKKNKIGVVKLTGSSKMDERQESIDRFQNDDETKVFVANIKAGGVGITLTKASIVIFADMEWSPEIHNQAMDRAHRIGQTGTVNVYYYIAKGTIEEDIMEVLESKKEIMDQILEGKRDKVKRSNIFGEVIRRISDKKT